MEAGLAQLKDPKRTNPFPAEEEAIAASEKAFAAKELSHSVTVQKNGLACCKLAVLEAH